MNHHYNKELFGNNLTVWAQDFCRNARSENRRDPAGRKVFRDEAVRQKDKSKQASCFRTVPKCVLAIGKFEGIHLGHRALIAQVVRRAKLAGAAAVIAVFEPHPFKFLRETDYKPLFSPQERDKMIYALSADEIITFGFDEKFAAMSAGDFCEKIFCDLCAVEIVAGENFRFGKNREGTVETLREAGAVFVVPQENFGGVAVSTSRIRELLFEKNFSEAEKLLGFSFFVSGEIEKGRRLGRTLGFPTLNIYPPGGKFLPQNGVYETRTILGGETFAGITNVGTRPTVSDSGRISVETHIPGLPPAELYGRHAKVEFSRFIRPERKFSSPAELQSQVLQDILYMKGEPK